MDPISSAPPSALAAATPAASTAAGTSASARSYLDFDGLGQLKGQAHQDAKSATRETAQQFEGLFIQMMMKSMREASFKSELNESSAKDTFEGMFDKEVSVQMAKRNTLGLADMLAKNMVAPEVKAPSTASVLEAREAGLPLHASTAAKAVSLQALPPSLRPLQRPGPIPLLSPKGRIEGSGL